MKSVVEEKSENEKIEFPALMKMKDGNNGDGLIILFSKVGYGTVINPGESSHKIGYNNHSWRTDLFERFEGSVTLSN
jgi:hypothetical protein